MCVGLGEKKAAGFFEEAVGVVAREVLFGGKLPGTSRADQICGNKCAGGISRAVFAIGAGGEKRDVVAVAKFREGRQGELLIAAACAADPLIGERDGGLAAGDQAVGARFLAHPHRHAGQVAADFFGRTFRPRGGDHRVRITEPLGFHTGRVHGRGIVSEHKMGGVRTRSVAD